jgi:hypothetical protein
MEPSGCEAGALKAQANPGGNCPEQAKLKELAVRDALPLGSAATVSVLPPVEPALIVSDVGLRLTANGPATVMVIVAALDAR